VIRTRILSSSDSYEDHYAAPQGQGNKWFEFLKKRTKSCTVIVYQVDARGRRREGGCRHLRLEHEQLHAATSGEPDVVFRPTLARLAAIVRAAGHILRTFFST
jgi:hypothetical protein